MEAVIISHVIKNFFGNFNFDFHSDKNFQIELLKPKNLQDAQAVIDLLLKNIPVIVNFDETDEDRFKQILDFIHGKITAAACNTEKINEKIFIFTPKNIEVKSVD